MYAIDLYGFYMKLWRYWRSGSDPWVDEIPRMNAETFAFNPDAALWTKLVRKHDPENYVIANFLMDNYKPKEFNDRAFTEWCAINESLMYRFKQDMETFYRNGPTMNLLRLLYDNKMSRESIIIMNAMVLNEDGSKRSMIKDVWLNSTDDMVRNEAFKLFKYTPFVMKRVDLEKYRTATKLVAAETI